MNCAAISESLIESELFGHERGAFTGAVTARAGWFETAQGGTLFLDEIGDLPSPASGEIAARRYKSEKWCGSARVKPIGIDVRLIAATNVELEGSGGCGPFP